MEQDNTEWHPGSFTKNFGWGRREKGLQQLYETIRIGFNNELTDVPRRLFRERVAPTGHSDYIPINFFLYNQIKDGVDHILVDELVFDALEFNHSRRFDRLALFAFNFSFVGSWKGSKPYQNRPALWAHHYISNRVAGDFNWNASKINANDIEHFISNDSRYTAKGARKLSTNLNYLYKLGDIEHLSEKNVDRWWVDALFLAMDRVLLDRGAQKKETQESNYNDYLISSNFGAISGRRSIEKDLASRHLLKLYVACGGRDRFSDESIRRLINLKLPDIQYLVANDPTPIAAIHPSNPRIVKTLPRECATLARYIAGFAEINADLLENFDVSRFIFSNLQNALIKLQNDNISPKISAEEFMKIMRD